MSGKLKKQLLEEGETYNFSDDELFRLFQWWECTPKICKYCSLPENLLDDLHNQEGHINKRYPQRGKSLEIDRMQSDLPYTVIENLVLACYWCNNAKTDEFFDDEFNSIGLAIGTMLKDRLK